MGIISVLIGFLCLAIGISISYFLFASKDKNKLTQVIKEYEKDKNSLLTEIEKQKKESVNYNTILTNLKQQNTELEERLQNAIEGHIDEEIKVKLKEVTRLQNDVKDFQEQIDDYKDSLSSIKKKLSYSKQENEELSKKNEEYEIENKNLNKELIEVKEKLSSNVEELKVKITSLDFIHEILTAEEVHKDGDEIAKKYVAIDNIVEIMRGDICSILKENSDIDKTDMEKFFGQSLTKWSIVSKKEWIQNKITIAFVGEYSAGKTSIVNRILSQDNPNIPLLPVSTKATTAIPTYISGSDNVAFTDYQFVTPTNVQKRIKEETFKKVNKEVLNQVKGVSNLIQYFVMTYNNPNLRNLSILDTPGFSSTDKEDAERTIEVINECDALFWVFDVNAGAVNRSSIQLIKDNLKKPLYVVINKVDTKSSREVDQVEQLIKKTLQDAGLSVQAFIRFSAKENLNSIMGPILSVTPDSSQKDYWKELIAFLENYKNEIQQWLNEVKTQRRQLELAIDNCVDKYVDRLKELQNQCEKASQVPQWTEHIFSKDRYEMSETEYQRLINHLNVIYSSPNDLVELFDDNGSKREEAVDITVKMEQVKYVLKTIESEIDKIKRNYKIYKS